MVIAKWLQIRMKDKVIVWQFYNESETEPFGSRGITPSDEEMQELQNLSFGELYAAKVDGVEVKDTPETFLEKIVKRAYDEYLEAKKVEEEAKEQTVEL